MNNKIGRKINKIRMKKNIKRRARAFTTMLYGNERQEKY